MNAPRELIYKTILEEMGFQALDEIQSVELARKVGQGAAERMNHIVDSRNALLKPANLIGSILAASISKSVRSFQEVKAEPQAWDVSDERERCAKIVEKRFPQDHKHANDCPVCILLKKIADEIRSGLLPDVMFNSNPVKKGSGNPPESDEKAVQESSPSKQE